MGKVLRLPIKKTSSKARKWTVTLLQQRLIRSQESICTQFQALSQQHKLIKQKKQASYQDYVQLLQITKALHEQLDFLSETLYNDERLPFLGGVLRYHLLSACYQVQQQTDALISSLMRYCVVSAPSLYSFEQIRLQHDILRTLTTLLRSEKELVSETNHMMDQMLFYRKASI